MCNSCITFLNNGAAWSVETYFEVLKINSVTIGRAANENYNHFTPGRAWNEHSNDDIVGRPPCDKKSQIYWEIS